MDAPWVRSPPNSNLEFIGADFATLASDLDWTLDEDGTYLAPGVMRFKRGWNVFKNVLEAAFSANYRADCFNCVGPRAITLAVKPLRRQLELAGFNIVPNHVLYPKNWITAHELVTPLPAGQAEIALRKMVEESWSIHLFGKMTNHLEIQAGSMASAAFSAFTLDLTRPLGLLSSASDKKASGEGFGRGIQLNLPKFYAYKTKIGEIQRETGNMNLRGSLDGRFDGLDLIFIRAVKRAVVRFATINVSLGGDPAWKIRSVSSSARLTATAAQAGTGARQIDFRLENASMKDVNVVLGSLVLVMGEKKGNVSGTLSISVQFGEEFAQGAVQLGLV